MASDTNIGLCLRCVQTLLVLSWAGTGLAVIDAQNRNVVQLYDVVQKKVKFSKKSDNCPTI